MIFGNDKICSSLVKRFPLWEKCKDLIKNKDKIMSKKKKTQPSQKKFTPESYIRQKARMLPIGDCYISDDWQHAGEAIVWVTRCHPQGTYTVGIYLVDTFCLGVKNSYYRFSIDSLDYEELLQHFEKSKTLRKVSYEEAHNLIYGAVAFAEEGGIQPGKSFALTQYLLEEDTDEIPLIEYEYGKDGKHFLMANDRLELNTYAPVLRDTLGADQFMYSLPEDEKPSNGEDYRYIDPETRSIFQNLLENLRNRPEIPEEVYSYHHPDYPVALNVKNQWLVTLFYDPDNAYYLPDETIRKVLALPHEELRNDLEQIILFETGCTCRKISREQWDAPYASVLLHCLFFLMALDDERSLPVVLETLCQSKDYDEYHFGDVATEVYVPVLYALGQNQLDKLFAYLQIPGLHNMFRYEVFPAVALVASRQPERRGEVIEWFRKVLQFYAPRLERQECCDGFLIGLMTSPILDLKAEELLPELKILYDTGLVDEGCCGDYDHIAKEISSNNNLKNIEHFPTDIYECYHNMKRFADNS